MSNKWRQLLAVKCSHIVFIIFGLELPYSTSEKFPLVSGTYSTIIHLLISGTQITMIAQWYASGRAVVDFRQITSLVTFNLSCLFSIVIMVEILFISRKSVVKYEQKLAEFTSDVQQYFGQKINYRETGLNIKFFFAETLLICWSIYYPLLFMIWHASNLLFASSAVMGSIRMFNFHFHTQTSIKCFLQIWRLNCLAEYLNQQLKNNFSYNSSNNLDAYQLDDFIQKIKELIDLVQTFCSTVSLQVCSQIVLINVVILQSFSYLLTPSLQNAYEQEYQVLAACMLSVGCCFMFALQVFLAQIADVTIANLKESAKISYKLYLMYPDGPMFNKKIEATRRKLLWLSRGSLTQNIRFNMGGIFDLGSRMIFRIVELSSTYLLFLMQYK